MPGRDLPLYRPCGDPELMPKTSGDTGFTPAPESARPPALLNISVIRLEPMEVPADEVPVYYTNNAQSYTAYCPEGLVGDPVVVTTPSGVITSDLSQEDADSQAYNIAKTTAESELVCVLPPVVDFLLLSSFDELFPDDAFLLLSGDQQTGGDMLGL